MNKNNARKITSILIVLLVIFAGAIYFGVTQNNENISAVPANASAVAQIGQKEIVVELATTTKQRERGLSGRTFLPSDTGMLFVFPEPLIPSFWMPDMHFPIDIAWIQDGKVVGIEEYISNEFDHLNPVYFRPSLPVQLVLEVNAGFVEKNGIEVGDSFDLIIKEN